VYVPGERAEITHAEAAPAPEAVSVALGVPIGVAPALGSVSVRTEGTDQTWYLDPKTLQRVGQPNINNTPATYTFVPEGGVWKVEVVMLG
jgi:hypothetical protein